MDIIYPSTLIPRIKGKYLILDTNIFIDSSLKYTIYSRFFNDLKKADIKLTTIDLVKYELLKGTDDRIKYEKRVKLIKDIIDVTIPVMPKTHELVTRLIRIYGSEGGSLNITDLFLGAILMQYRENICLFTRDTTDFIQRIFELLFVINVQHTKGIFTYGIYQYKVSKELLI